ncbi:hypothetical protein HPB49_000108 [Dermacentor silvarum]|uniref:Uncharacterized protein n=1 Tax=Dermacentor silvarum TaxID=543639 RepID=A0ACB8DS43_DERSI|nr:hypothetical protein HPB49_000108 [Dermacentor silvarum]
MTNREEDSPPDPGAASTPPEHEDMDTHTGLANLQVGKRPRDQTNSLATMQDSSGGDEPPPKAPAMTNREEDSPPDPGAASTPPEHEDMDTHTGLANLQVGKRPRDQTNSLATMQDSSGGDEPPPKAPEKAEDSVAVNAEVKSLPEPGATSTPPEPQGMDTHTGLANLQAGKRPHDQANSLATLQDSNDGDEPPPKTPDAKEANHEAVPTNAWKGVFPDNTTPQTSEVSLTGETQEKEKGKVVEAVLAVEAQADAQVMEVESGASAKRPRDEAGNEVVKPSASSGDEPPTKTVMMAGLQTGRRPSFKPKPTVPPDRKMEGTMPS